MAEKRESFNPLLKSYPDSEKVNACSLGAETLFTRLIAQSDDYAHYYAEPRMVLAKLYTLRMVNGEVSASDVEGWLTELAREGLIVCYEIAGKKYLEIANCKKALRNDVLRDERFPPRPSTVLNPRDPAALTDAARGRNEDVTDTGRVRDEGDADARRVRDEHVPLTQPNPTQPNPFPAGESAGGERRRTDLIAYPDGMQRFWDAYPKRGRIRSSRAACMKVWSQKKLEVRTDEVLTALAKWNACDEWAKEDGKYVPAADRFLREGKFEDPPEPSRSQQELVLEAPRLNR